MKGADKGVWCWACKLLSKQRRVVVRVGIKLGLVVRPMVVASANCGEDPQWHYTQCGSAVLVMFTAWILQVWDLVSARTSVVLSLKCFGFLVGIGQSTVVCHPGQRHQVKVSVFSPDTLFRYGPFCYMHGRLFLSGGLLHLGMVGFRPPFLGF